MPGPIGPPGYNGSQGPVGPQGALGPAGPKGSGDFSQCQYKNKSGGPIPGGSDRISVHINEPTVSLLTFILYIKIINKFKKQKQKKKTIYKSTDKEGFLNVSCLYPFGIF